jgi:hypothetical protein
VSVLLDFACPSTLGLGAEAPISPILVVCLFVVLLFRLSFCSLFGFVLDIYDG